MTAASEPLILCLEVHVPDGKILAEGDAVWHALKEGLEAHVIEALLDVLLHRRGRGTVKVYVDKKCVIGVSHEVN